MTAVETDLTDRQRDAAATALERFCGDDRGRSAALTVVVDGRPVVRHGIRDDVPRPAASLAKLPLVMTVLRAAGCGGIALDERVCFAALPPSSHPALTDVLDRTHTATLRELCGLALVTSDNPLAQYLLDRVGHHRVAALLEELGCRATRLSTGFADADLAERPRANTTTAADMARILDRLLDADEMAPACFALTRAPKASRLLRLVRAEGGATTGHKTGSLSRVCNDAGFVADDRVSVRLAVLCDDQADVALCEHEMGACLATVWHAVAAQAG